MRVFSGIRPTGELHIGNYLGAIKQWMELQEKNECVFCIVDLHAITTPYRPGELQRNIMDLATAYLAADLDPEKCIFFVQSQIKEHSELAWILGTLIPLGELQRMTQFKEKSKKHPEYVNAGLLNYPLLMAADILLYQTEAVPVGKDQQQHVELTREIARRFNKKFGITFKEPRTLLPKIGEKIMSLQNPVKKMSKTDDSRGCIGLFDEPDQIKEKVMKAVTDTGKTIKYNPKLKPGISNLLTIYSLFTQAAAKGKEKDLSSSPNGKPIKEVDELRSSSPFANVRVIEKKFKDKGYAELKKQLAELLISKLEVFRRKRKELLTREVYVKEILNQGVKRARVIAQSTMTEVRKKIGLS